MALPLAAAMASTAARSAVAAPVETVDDAVAPLGIALEGWPYPAPVSFLPLTIGGERLRMAYMDFAPTARPDGRTVLLLHGKNFDSGYWGELAPWLSTRGFRVIVADQIGFNKSSKPALDYTFELLARNSFELLDALGAARVTILGHSTGGALAIKMASLAPHRVERLVLEDPIGIVRYRDHIPMQETATLVEAEKKYTAETYRAFIANFFVSYPSERYETFVTWRMRVARSGEFERFATAAALTYQMIHREPLDESALALGMPTLLTAGTRDRSTPLVAYAPASVRPLIPTIHQAAERLAGANRSIRFVSFPDTGHVPHLEAAERFRTVLAQFLER